MKLGNKMSKAELEVLKPIIDCINRIITTQPRYLVYKTWNGQVHASIEHGNLFTGEGVKKDPTEIKRFEIKHKIDNLKFLKELYPVEN